LTDNDFSQYVGDGISLHTGEGGGQLNLTVTNNTLTGKSQAGQVGIIVNSGVKAADTKQICLNLSSNNIGSHTPAEHYWLYTAGTTTVALQGYTGSDNDLTAIKAFLDSQQVPQANGTVNRYNNSNIKQNTGDCPTPEFAASPVDSAPVALQTTPFTPEAHEKTGVSLFAQVITDTNDAWQSLLSHLLPVGSRSGLASLVPVNRAGPLASGESIEVGPFDLPPGKSITIWYNAVINNPFPSSKIEVCNQGQVQIAPYTGILTDDPRLPGSHDPTCILVYRPADLAISKTSPTSSAIPGELASYTIQVINLGPADVAGVVVGDDFTGLSSVTWTCTPATGAACPASGSGMLAASVDIPAGKLVTFTASGLVPPSATGILSNTAAIIPPEYIEDPDLSNNYSTLALTLTPQADLSISKSDEADSATPGQSIGYTILVENHGSSDAPGTRIVDSFPAAILNPAWTCSASGGAACPAASGTGNLDTLANIPVGSGLSFTAAGQIDPGASGSLSNTATVTPAGSVSDPDLDNNTATDVNALQPQADLALSISNGVDGLTPGLGVTYTLAVTNHGPSSATGSILSLSMPVQVGSLNWSCASAGSGFCPAASGSGQPPAALDLSAHQILTFTITGTIDPAASGEIAVSASISPASAVIDPESDNNSHSDSDPLTPQADLAISKLVDQPYVHSGGNLTYTLVVTNPAGPSQISGVNIIDALPVTLENATWTCSAVDASCPQTVGSGSLDEILDLPVGGELTFTIQAGISPGASGLIVTNTASIHLPTGSVDPDLDNNSASATTQVDAPPEITALDLDTDEIDEGDTITLTVDFDDPHIPEAHTVLVDWGDGSQSTINLESGLLQAIISHRYLDVASSGVSPSLFSITVTVSEADGGQDTATTQVTVNNVPPQIGGINVSDIAEGDTAVLEVVFSDPGELDTFTATIDWGDGSDQNILEIPAGLRSFTASHLYRNNPPGEPAGSFTISIELVDDDGGSASDATSLVVTNVTPQVFAGSDLTTTGMLERSGHFIDPGEDIWSATVDYGDGSGLQALTLDGKTFMLAHTYTKVGNFTVIVTVTDGDGATGSDSFVVTTVIDSDLSLAINAVPNPVLAGGTLEYTIVVTNLSGIRTTGIDVLNALPHGVQFIDASSGCSLDSNLVVCRLAELAAYASTEFTISVRVEVTFQGTLISSATVCSDATDPDLDNNTDTAFVEVVAEQVFYQSDFASGEFESISTTPSGRVFLGEFGNNDAVSFQLGGLPEHSKVTLSYTLFILRSWDGNQVEQRGRIGTTFGRRTKQCHWTRYLGTESGWQTCLQHHFFQLVALHPGISGQLPRIGISCPHWRDRNRIFGIPVLQFL
jgi:uncharacterized repeat protein (TIGR01451 family)